MTALGEQLRETEWGQVLALARAGRVATLVYAQVAAVGLLFRLPPAIYSTFAEEYRETLLENLRIRTVQERLLGQLAAAGIAAISLKGVALAERLFGNIGRRPTRDIDLLVHRADIPRIDSLLAADGYYAKPGQDDAGAFESIATTETKHIRDDSPMIEMHWGLSKRPTYRHGLAAEGVWRRATTATWHGQTIQVLSTADELRYLAVHCTADHIYSQLNWLVDIAELVRQLPDGWRWDDFAAETVAAGLATPVGLALAQCRAVLQLDIPNGALLTLLRAGESAGERAAWRTAWEKRLSRRWIVAHVREIPSPPERVRFALGASARALAQRTGLRRSWSGAG